MRRLAALSVLAVVLCGAYAAAAHAMASHRGWPPYDGMLLMNENDSSRPLDGRVGFNPFGSADRKQGCKDTGDKPTSSCKHWIRHDGGQFVVQPTGAHHRLYGGHGNDTIHAGDNGDVLWGDYKPSGQPTSQRDLLVGGAGPDFIYASHGRNVIQGGAGNDSIHAHFGRGTVDCGPGRDVLYIHGGKRKAYKRVNCEVVTRKTGESAPNWLLKTLPWAITDNQTRE